MTRYRLVSGSRPVYQGGVNESYASNEKWRPDVKPELEG